MRKRKGAEVDRMKKPLGHLFLLQKQYPVETFFRSLMESTTMLVITKEGFVSIVVQSISKRGIYRSDGFFFYALAYVRGENDFPRIKSPFYGTFTPHSHPDLTGMGYFSRTRAITQFA